MTDPTAAQLPDGPPAVAGTEGPLMFVKYAYPPNSLGY
jgi:hypothetical protein